jgi:hypothetical protein
MDDDHRFPEGHLATVAAAVSSDPDAIWVIGERGWRNGTLVAEPLAPGQLNANGVADEPPSPQASWAIADGATIYPREVFVDDAMCEDFMFGQAYLEWGARLYARGWRARLLEGTYVFHDYDYTCPETRSFSSLEAQLSSGLFAALALAFLYQPRLDRKVIASSRVAKLIVRHRVLGVRCVCRGVAAFWRRRAAPLRLRDAGAPTQFDAEQGAGLSSTAVRKPRRGSADDMARTNEAGPA